MTQPYDPVKVQQLAVEISQMVRRLSDDDLLLHAALKCASDGYLHTLAVTGILAATKQAMGE